MTKAAAFVLAALMMSTQAFAQTVEGTWRGTTTGGTEVVLQLHVEGERVTGTMTRGAEASPLENGRIEGKTVRFSVTARGQTVSFTAELKGEQLFGYIDEAGPGSALAFERVR